ncbi:MAG: hypothetical protein AUG89_11550 [Acidobacteria bacterium 13_1_20CM_4_56_7]|nr:MAG: hypothetical protein AUG89_11550 [Acidobacteria bacterium 13_1_20CM_4_56_7]
MFESLLMYFRVKSSDDYQRALKVELMNKGFVDESVNFIPDNERYKVDAQLVELGLRENATLIAQHSGGYTAQNQNSGVDKREKTRFQVMSEVQQMTSLVNSALMQAYHYQVFEYKEIFRRFCKKHSSDPDVRSFRAACLRQDVPESLLKPEAWDIDPVRVMGAGNKTLEMTIAEQLLSMRNLYDPEPQREILRDVTLAITDDPARAEALVPEQPQISDSIHDAQLSFGTLMTGAPVAIKSGVNRQEVIAALLASMSSVVRRIQQSGGMADAKDIVGLQNVGQHIAQHIQILAGDKNEKQRVKQFGDVLGKLMNLVKGFAQRLHEQMQKQNGQGQVDPKDIAKIKATQITADAKSKNTRESHAQKTVQRQIQFEQGLKQKEQEHALELRRKTAETRLDLAASKAKAAIDIRKSRMKSTSEE